jgi:hypothetical protein
VTTPTIVIELADTPIVVCDWRDSDNPYVTAWFDDRPNTFRLLAELIAAAERETGQERAA